MFVSILLNTTITDYAPPYTKGYSHKIFRPTARRSGDLLNLNHLKDQNQKLTNRLSSISTRCAGFMLERLSNYMDYKGKTS